MPIYLPPISRRRFLKGSLAAAAALAAGQGFSQPTKKVNPQSIALLSDIHIAANAKHISHDVNMTDNLRQVVSEVVAWPELPAMAFINGDLAFNDGLDHDYAAVMKLIQPIREAGLPMHLGMGNHDDREHFWKTMQASRTEPANLPGRQADIIRTPEANWFLLDSLIKTRTTPGLLGDAQLAWLSASLDANTDKPAIMMIHHQPSGLQDSSKLFAIIRPRKQVKAYFFGHTHHWRVTQDPSGIHLVNLPTTAYLFDEGLPNGWVHAEVKEDRAKLELRCIDAKRAEHGQKVDLAWRTA